MVKPRENRVPIMMSDEEVAAIDDWRFANRVATRSDAVRQLTKTGLAAHNLGPSFLHVAAERVADMNAADAELEEFYDRITSVEDEAKAKEMMDDFVRAMMKHYEVARQSLWEIYLSASEALTASSEKIKPELTDKEHEEILREIRIQFGERP